MKGAVGKSLMENAMQMMSLMENAMQMMSLMENAMHMMSLMENAMQVIRMVGATPLHKIQRVFHSFGEI